MSATIAPRTALPKRNNLVAGIPMRAMTITVSAIISPATPPPTGILLMLISGRIPPSDLLPLWAEPGLPEQGVPRTRLGKAVQGAALALRRGKRYRAKGGSRAAKQGTAPQGVLRPDRLHPVYASRVHNRFERTTPI